MKRPFMRPLIVPPETHIRAFLSRLGIPASELADPSLDLQGTPARVTRMYRDELLASYKPGALEDLRTKFRKFDSDGKDAFVLLGPTKFHSLCSHHMLPFYGEAYVGYLPGENVIGASKAARVVVHFSRMLQIQERMTRQVADFVFTEANARAVVVLVRAAHECMRCRGVGQSDSRMVTTSVRPLRAQGDDEDIDNATISEFYAQMSVLRGG